MNSVGHISAYLDMVESLERRRRRFIIIREMFLALCIMVIFNYVGDFLLLALEVDTQTILLSGGLILFLIAIRMIFPHKKHKIPIEKEEPFIFPIATPMIAGPSCLTTIMLYSHQSSRHNVILAILVAWAFSITFLLLAQRIKDLVGKRALNAIERLMGLILTMMAVEMLLKGLKSVAIEGIT
jgi:multiple antibiotic resistance protein